MKYLSISFFGYFHPEIGEIRLARDVKRIYSSVIAIRGSMQFIMKLVTELLPSYYSLRCI